MTEKKQKSICVFCGSSDDVADHYFELARATGHALAKKGIRLVYGGGGVGLMGASAKACHDAGGDVLGIIPEFLQAKEVVYEDVEHVIVPDMRTRKQMMYDAADAFIVLPGGIGTLEEAIEVISWLRIRLHTKPIVFLDIDDYWKPIVDLIAHTVEARFTPDWLLEHLHRANSAGQAIEIIQAAWREQVDITKM